VRESRVDCTGVSLAPPALRWVGSVTVFLVTVDVVIVFLAPYTFFPQEYCFERLAANSLLDTPKPPTSFKSFPTQEDDHLWAVLRYVERNPLRAILVKDADAENRSRVGGVAAAGGAWGSLWPGVVARRDGEATGPRPLYPFLVP
jgi:hypothetical protein